MTTRGSRAWGALRLTAWGGLCLSLAVSALAPPSSVQAAEATHSSLVTGWLPSWATPAATAAVVANDDLVDVASPFWYTAKAANGTVAITSSVAPATRDASLAALRARKVALLPSIADGSSALQMAAVLKNPKDRAVHVAQLVSLVVSSGFDGIELDYERFAFSDGRATWAETRPAWVAFVNALGTALHAQNRKLALAVPPMYDGKRSTTSGYWVYDYAGIAPAVDSLRIMTYDYSVSRPGPIAPLAFLHKTLSYAVTAFPRDRIRMGVPAYGRLWVARKADGSKAITGTCPATGVPGTTSFTTATAATYLRKVAGAPIKVSWDAARGESFTRFSVKYAGVTSKGKKTSCVVTHEAWWADARGLAGKLPLVKQYGLAGVAVWHLGGLDAASWRTLRAYAQGLPPTAPPAATPVRITVKPSTTRPRKGATVKVKVAISPARKKVKVKRQMRINGKWRTMATKSTSASGKVTFKVHWPKKKVTYTYRIVTKKRGDLAGGKSPTFKLRTR